MQGEDRSFFTAADFSGSVSIASLQLRQEIKVSGG